jgi:hypothetical protein
MSTRTTILRSLYLAPVDPPARPFRNPAAALVFSGVIGVAIVVIIFMCFLQAWLAVLIVVALVAAGIVGYLYWPYGAEFAFSVRGRPIAPQPERRDRHRGQRREREQAGVRDLADDPDRQRIVPTRTACFADLAARKTVAMPAASSAALACFPSHPDRAAIPIACASIPSDMRLDPVRKVAKRGLAEQPYQGHARR